MKIMFLTAGLGTRLRPATLFKPKPALELLNIPLLGYGQQLTECLQADRVVANAHYMPDEVIKLVQKLWPNPAYAHLSDETSKILGSGGGISKARELLEADTMLFANGDEVFLPAQHDILNRVRINHESSAALATLVVMKNDLVGTKFGGVWTDLGSNQVVGFGKQAPVQGLQGWHFTGYMFLSSKIFQYLQHDRDCNILYDGLAAAIAKGEHVNIFPVSGDWFEVGHTADFFTVTGGLLQQLVTLFEGQAASESEFVGADELSSQYLLELTRHFNAGFLAWNKNGQTTARPILNHHGNAAIKVGWDLNQINLKENAVALIAADAEIEGRINIREFAVIGHGCAIPAIADSIDRSIIMSGAKWPNQAGLKNEIVVI